ncbi:unnamed protein product [Cylicocyclus nassatus]|uniref:Uncharacterized protein n=1 Tax=Cylicocyclus nassatus TaxID=53992 RepID=A0AA36HH93_CYLNA|nr:unnamed protein product [Cylicocyclus nassatus]
MRIKQRRFPWKDVWIEKLGGVEKARNRCATWCLDKNDAFLPRRVRRISSTVSWSYVNDDALLEVRNQH